MTQTENSAGVRLLRKGQKGLWNLIFSRMLLIVLLLLIQLGLLFSVFRWLGAFVPHIIGGQFLLTFGMVLYLFNSRHDPTAKLTWMAVIMMAPVFGSLLYLFTIREFGHRALKKRVAEVMSRTQNILPQAADGLKTQQPGIAAMAGYVRKNGGYPIYPNTDAVYFPLGEDKFSRLLKELEQAREFIFLEYFIIEEGAMWGQILEILIRKAKQGVDVRVMYDGTCEFLLLPKGYDKMLRSLGIRCKVFSPFVPLMSTHYNYRDHRKIVVIDGHTAFNGGVNLADEYINAYPKHGHWKDTAVMIKGEAVKSFTLMFLQNWALDEKDMELDRFLSQPPAPTTSKGWIMPYADSPLDGERVGQQVYMDILNRARRYVYIMTPYLILDAELENALKYAAARGVEVKLVLPGIPDKRIPYALAKTHYKSLMDSGVQIYEYTPGFVHAKVFLCDDCEAVVGTINLDYRSLYHHFECATYLYDAACIPDIAKDFDNTLAKCRQVTKTTLRNEKWTVKLLGRFFKIFAPLL